MRLPVLSLGALLLAAGPANADRLDDAIKAEMARRHVPGVGILVIKDGKVIREKGYGLANVEHNVPVGPQTVFQSASIGKTFTAALVMLLAEDGKLGLDDKVSKHLANTPKAWEAITIRHLLTHTSGLGDPYQKLDLRKDYTDEELIALEATIPMLFAPGEKWVYSNMGYHLLGFICTRAGGKFYGEQLRERIFEPLGMGARIVSESDIVPHRAAGYDWRDGKLKNQDWVAPRLNTTADGTVHVTARDLGRWDRALYGDKILSARAREASWTPAKLNDGKSTPYGYGWFVGPVNGHRRISHSGAWQGFKTQINRYVDDRLTVIVLANSSHAKPNKFGELIAAHYIPALAVVPAKPIRDNDPAAAARVRGIIDAFVNGEVPAGLSESMKAIYTVGTIRSFGKEVREWGPLLGAELLEHTTDGELRHYRYRYKFKHETVAANVSFGKNRQIERLKIWTE
ncbi:serine hydrolase domain-containing protein [Massilia glaciei]|uniref:Beta-lactamase-related domain-containing protein n=1 Tax=Massilia glaciei TaxID=1524097 RepID=A0A2U2H9Z4_9BURK|nr:serine hydrolase domain-containing protein [Massilia glaciei]PWF39446.1 hypothetical protein C7C56_026985 [Massilia glaciei]